MFRSTPYIDRVDTSIQDIIGLSSHSGLLVLQNTGPTSFVIGDPEGKKFKVLLGDINSCTCQKRIPMYCIHLAFVITRVFRVPEENPLAWQKGFIDTEIKQLVSHAFDRRQRQQISKRSASADRTGREVVEQREIDEDSICAICQEKMTAKQPLSFCKFGCGNSVHTRCLKIWVQHNKSVGNKILCPFCRVEWGPIETSVQPRATCLFVHLRARCSCCGASPIIGPRLRCMICPDFNLCVNCYKNGVHPNHSFQSYDTNTSHPRILEATPQRSEISHDILALQQREITNLDHSLLLALDSQNHHKRKFALVGKLLSIGLPMQDGDETTCSHCEQTISETQKMRRGTCGHCFHVECLQPFLSASDECPACTDCLLDYGELVEMEDVVKEKIDKSNEMKRNRQRPKVNTSGVRGREESLSQPRAMGGRKGGRLIKGTEAERKRVDFELPSLNVIGLERRDAPDSPAVVKTPNSTIATPRWKRRGVSVDVLDVHPKEIEPLFEFSGMGRNERPMGGQKRTGRLVKGMVTPFVGRNAGNDGLGREHRSEASDQRRERETNLAQKRVEREERKQKDREQQKQLETNWSKLTLEGVGITEPPNTSPQRLPTIRTPSRQKAPTNSVPPLRVGSKASLAVDGRKGGNLRSRSNTPNRSDSPG